MADEVAKLTTVFDADTSGVERGIASTDAGLTGLTGRISNTLGSAGTAFTGMGRSILTASAPMVAGMALMVNSALGFGTQMTNIQAVTGMTSAEIQSLGDDILDVDSKFSNVELASTFYDIAGGVVDVNARMDVFNTAIAVAQAGNAGLQGTTQALIGTINAYGAANLEAAHAGDVLVRTVGMGVGTMDQFAAALPNVTGLAASVGISFDEIAAATAYLTTKGNTASEATTQLAAAINSLLTPNTAMTAAFQNAGIESGSLALSTNGLMGTLNLLKDSFGGNIDAMAQAFGSVEALRAVVSLAGGDVDEFFATFEEGVVGATDAAEQIQMEDAAAQIALLKGEMDDLQVIAGGALAPALVDVAQETKPLVKQFASFAKTNPQIIRQVALLTIGAVGLGTAFVVLGTVLSSAATVFTAAGIAMAFLLSPIGLVLAGALALGAAFYWLYNNNVLGFRDAVVDARAALQDIEPAMRDAANSAQEFATQVGADARVKISEMGSAMRDAANDARNFALDLKSGFEQRAFQGLAFAIESALQIGSLIATGYEKGQTLGSSIIGGIRTAFATYISGAFNFTTNIPGILDTMIAQGTSLGGSLFDGIVESAKSSFNISGIMEQGLSLATVGTAISTFGRLKTAIGLIGPVLSVLMTPLGIATLGIVGLGAALYIAYSQNIFGFKDAIDKYLVPAFQRGGLEAAKFVANIIAAFQSGGLSAATQQIITGLSQGANQAGVAAQNYGPAIATGLSGGMQAAGPQITQGLSVIGQKVDEESPKLAEKGGMQAGQLTGQFIAGLITYAPTILLGLLAIGVVVMKYLTIDLPQAVVGWVGEVTLAFAKGFIAGIITEGPSIVTAFSNLGGDIFNAVAGGLDSIMSKARDVLAQLGLVRSAQASGPIIAGGGGGPADTQRVLNTSLALPGRALGGTVMAGTAYQVNEKRPELFVPSMSGRIIPNLDVLTTPQGRNTTANEAGNTTFNGPFIFQGVNNLTQLYEELARLNKQRGSNAAFAIR